MKIEVVSLFKQKCAHTHAIEKEYLDRCARSLKIQVKELVPKVKATASVEQSQSAYQTSLESCSNACLVLLEESGELLSSKKLATFIEQHKLKATKCLRFAVGGPFGWNAASKESAEMLLSISTMTFPAHIARLLLIEQLYRAHTIMEGISYHK
jgi:23S rRNA (pseudouridine1915-N3)-methyltransferase